MSDKRYLNQKAVYWAPAGRDSAGDPTYAAAVEYKVRWEDTTEVFINQKGQNQTSRSKVYLGTSQSCKLDGVLWLGALSSLSGSNLTNPFKNAGAWVIARVDRIPNRKGTKIHIWAYL